jgi:hypothetical protein
VERRLNEEDITLSLMKFLRAEGWIILSFDYPGSGTGDLLRDPLSNSKSAGWKPDIIAHFDGDVLLIETKPKYNKTDDHKLANWKQVDWLILEIERRFNISSPKLIYALAYDPGEEIGKKFGINSDSDFHVTANNVLEIK